jgi:hypothetical protein
MFMGAALFVTIVVHPARNSCDLNVALAEWRTSYKKAAQSQLLYIIISLLSRIICFYYSKDYLCFASDLLITLHFYFSYAYK